MCEGGRRASNAFQYELGDWGLCVVGGGLVCVDCVWVVTRMLACVPGFNLTIGGFVGSGVGVFETRVLARSVPNMCRSSLLWPVASMTRVFYCLLAVVAATSFKQQPLEPLVKYRAATIATFGAGVEVAKMLRACFVKVSRTGKLLTVKGCRLSHAPNPMI